MTRSHLYRTLVAGALALAAVVTLPGCDSTASHQSIKQEQYSRWNDTRIGVLYQLATQQYQVGSYDKCRETLAQAFALKHPFAPVHVLAARVDIEKGDLESASNHLKTAVQIDASSAESYYLLGVVYQRWQNMQAAHDYYQLAWDRKPAEALYLLAVAEMKMSLGQYDAAQQLLEEKLVYFEQTAAVRAALAKLHTLKGDYATASKYYREATILSPEDINLRQNYAEALFFAGKYADALPVLEGLDQGGKVTDRANLLILLGQTYLNVHRPKDARTCFAEITRNNPQNTLALLNLGKATLQMDDYVQAASVARRILKEQPDHLQALILLALAQQKQKQWDQAQETLQHATAVAPQDSTVLCLLGVNAQMLGHRDEAADFFTKAVTANPDDAWAKELLASAKTGAGQ